MEDPVKRRMEILAEIARLGKQQKKSVRVIISTGRRSPKGDVRYDERARRIAGLVLELAGLDKFPRLATRSPVKDKKREPGTVSGLSQGDKFAPNERRS
jgi:hypothetical protein